MAAAPALLLPSSHVVISTTSGGVILMDSQTGIELAVTKMEQRFGRIRLS